MADNSKPLIIVVSRNYSTGLGVIRSLGAAGYEVDLIASVMKRGTSVIASSSRYVRNHIEVVSAKTQEDKGTDLVYEILKYSKLPGEKIVFTVDDYTTTVADNYRNMLSEHFTLAHVTPGSEYTITQLMEKTLQTKLAKEAGLLTPLEWTVSLRGDVTVPEDIKYPCFVKPLQSFTGQKTEMGMFTSEETLLPHLLEMKAFYSDREVLIQEYLNIDREIDLSGICLDQEIIIPAIIEKTRIAKHHRGITMQGRMAPPEKLGALLEKIKEMLKSFHYYGMFDMEFNVCGDRIYFNEVNLRSGGPNYSYYLNGVNLPEILVKELSGEGHSPEEEVMAEFGRLFIYEKVAWEDYMHGFMSFRELNKAIRESDYTLIENKDDPAPGKVFNRRIRLSAAKNKLKGFTKRSRAK